MKSWRGVPEGERPVHWIKGQDTLRDIGYMMKRDLSFPSGWAYTPKGDTGPRYEGHIKFWVDRL